MPTNVVDFSALSEIIRDEPWQLHFWELTPAEYFEQMKNPRKFIEKMGIELPENTPIVTEMLNHDFLAAHTDKLAAADTPPIRVCNMGGGNTGIAAYRITSYAHLESDVGRFKKKLLHRPDEKKVRGT
jgi:hypothetical protein